MHKYLKCFSLLIVVILFLFACCAKAFPPETTFISSFLPDPADVKGWKKTSAFELYQGENLFEYINGGAEIYHEYGFKQVLVQDFSTDEGRSISVEIFEMTKPEASYGIYTFKSSSEGRAVAFGIEGRLEGYYLNFWRSSFLVTLTGFDEKEETVQGLTLIAKAIDNRMKTLQNVETPRLIHLLPEGELVKPSTKYFLGSLGLFNTYPFSTNDIFKIKEGVRGRYAPGHEIIIITYTDDQAAIERFQEASRHFKQSPRYKNFQLHQNNARFEDKKGKLIFIQPHKNDIIIVLGTHSFTDAEKIAMKAQSRIRDIGR